MEEKKLLGSQREILRQVFQNSEIARMKLKEINEMILEELDIPKKDWQFWVFSNDLTKVVNRKTDPPKMPNPKMPKGNK